MSKSTDIGPGKPAIVLVAGDICGLYEILECLPSQAAVPARAQRYRVRYRCCGTEVIRVHATLLNARRHPGATRCQRCVVATRKSRHRLGERFGPVVIVALSSPNTRQVRWDCCGIIKTATAHYLSVLRHDAQRGHLPRCKSCAALGRERAKASKRRRLPQEQAWSPATAWPRPGSLTGARA